MSAKPPTPDLDRQKRFILQDGTVVQVSFLPTGVFGPDGIEMYKQEIDVSGFSGGVSDVVEAINRLFKPLLDETSLFSFSKVGIWTTDGGAFVAGDEKKLFDADLGTYLETTGTGSNDLYFLLHDGARLSYVNLTVSGQMVSSGLLRLRAQFMDGTFEDVISSSAAGGIFPDLSGVVSRPDAVRQLVLSVTGLTAGDYIRFAGLEARLVFGVSNYTYKDIGTLFNGSVAASGTASFDVNLDNAKVIAVQVAATPNSGATAGIEAHVLTKILSAAEWDTDRYAEDLAPTFNPGVTSRRTTNIDPIPRDARIVVNNPDPVHACGVKINILRVY